MRPDLFSCLTFCSFVQEQADRQRKQAEGKQAEAEQKQQKQEKVLQGVRNSQPQLIANARRAELKKQQRALQKQIKVNFPARARSFARSSRVSCLVSRVSCLVSRSR